jgi:cytochrome c556
MKSNNRFFTHLITAVILVVLTITGVLAKEKTNPEDSIYYRQDLMGIVKGSSSALGAILKKEVEFDKEAIPLAQTLAMSARQSREAFKLNTSNLKGEDIYTGASPDIWKNWDDFVGRWNKLEVAANDLAKAIEKGDKKAIKKAAKVIGGSCKGCHDKYMVDDE